EYISEAINSCLIQTYENIEILVIDDGSTDETKNICKSYGDKIKYYKKNNGGASSALNFGIKISKGEYISWLSHDDYYSKEKIENQMKVAEIKPKNSIIFSDFCVVNEKRKIVSKVKFNLILKNFNASKSLLLICSWKLNGCMLLIPKSIFNNHGLFDEKLLYTQDYDMWTRLVNENFEYDNNVAFFSRINPHQTSRKIPNHNTDEDDLWSNFLKFIYSNNMIDKFLGYDLSTTYFYLRMKDNKRFVKTNLFISSLLNNNIQIKKNRKILIKHYRLIKNKNKLKVIFKNILLVFSSINNDGFLITFKKIFKN
ncbi:MAG: glycosyltransferase, partial [Mycoplasma sp.]